MNEAFAAQFLAVGKTLGFDPQKVNVNGGAIALLVIAVLVVIGVVVTAVIMRKKGKFGKNKSEKKGTE